MCLYPKLVRNPRYKKNKKNGGVIPPVFDNRHLYIPVGCQVCKECRKRKARDWQVRLQEEIKTNSNGHMITFTFSTEGLQKITDNYPEIAELEGYEKDNAIAKKGLRLFLENWRKKHKKSVRHWAITELGHQGTEHVHIHEATKMGITLQAAQIENMQKQIEIASFNAWTGRWSHRLNVGMAEWKKLMEDVAESTRLKVDVVNGILKGILIGQIAK